MSTLRVAFVTHTTGMYGANRSMLALVRELRERGIEPRVLSPRGGAVTDELEAEGVPHRVIRFHRWRSRGPRWRAPLRLAGNLTSLPAIASQLRDWDADVVYTNSSVVPVGMWAAEVVGLPHVWHVREFGRADYGLRHDWGRAFFSFWLRRSEVVVTVSEALRRHLARHLDREIHVVYNGVVSREEALRLRDRAAEAGAEDSSDGAAGDASGPYVFAIVGTLGGRKGQAEAVDALSLVREMGVDARLRIAGSGPDDEEVRLRRRAAERGVADAVEFLGFVEDPFEVYLEADAVLVCSPNEAMGRVTAEAMLAGRPVIGYRGGATPEMVEDGESGLLYDDGSTELADRMAHLTARPDQGRRMGRRGWKRAFPAFTVEEYAGRIQGLIEGAAADHAHGSGKDGAEG